MRQNVTIFKISMSSPQVFFILSYEFFFPCVWNITYYFKIGGKARWWEMNQKAKTQACVMKQRQVWGTKSTCQEDLVFEVGNLRISSRCSFGNPGSPCLKSELFAPPLLYILTSSLAHFPNKASDAIFLCPHFGCIVPCTRILLYYSSQTTPTAPGGFFQEASCSRKVPAIILLWRRWFKTKLVACHCHRIDHFVKIMELPPSPLPAWEL